jgi:hypothetical protein
MVDCISRDQIAGARPLPPPSLELVALNIEDIEETESHHPS